MFDRVTTKARSPREEVPEEDLAEDIKFKSYVPLAGTQAQIEQFMKEDYIPAVTLTKVIQDPSAKNLDKRAHLVAKLGPAKNLTKHKSKEAAYSKQVEKANLPQDFAGILVSPSPKCRRIQPSLLHSGLVSLSGSPNLPVASTSRLQLCDDIDMGDVQESSPNPTDGSTSPRPQTSLFLTEDDVMAAVLAESSDIEVSDPFLADSDEPMEVFLKSIEAPSDESTSDGSL